MGLGLLLLILFLVNTVSGESNVTNLPGYDGSLPFTLQTGYVGVDENQKVQLFYYFVESQNNPSKDPLLLWITGGPGCSGLGTFFFEHGPLTMDIDNYVNGSIPTILQNPYAWTEIINVIFLDAPVGTGFSYSQNSDVSNMGDYKFAAHIYEFLQMWLTKNSRFSKSDLYVGGEGYTGKIVPIVGKKILDGNEDRSMLTMNIKGYVLGNPGTNDIIDFNAQTTFAHRLALIPNGLYKSAKNNCNYNFTTENPSIPCKADMEEINQLICQINQPNILKPSCVNCTSSVATTQDDLDAKRSLKGKHCPVNRSLKGKHCPKYNQMVCEAWANNKSVQEALHIQEGSITSWSYCSNDENYSHEVSSVVDYHLNFSKLTNLKALINSGDHDMSVSYIGTQKWIRSLQLTLVEKWRAWLVDDEIAGYTKRFTNNGHYNLTFATVKGAGHFVTHDKAKECFEMIKRWMASDPL